jgi:hypothetical protein
MPTDNNSAADIGRKDQLHAERLPCRSTQAPDRAEGSCRAVSETALAALACVSNITIWGLA